MRFYVGTYTETLPYLQGRGPGLLLARLSSSGRSVEVEQTLTGIPNPTHLARHPSGRSLYAVNQTERYRSDGSGSITALSVSSDGRLRTLNVASSEAPMPCHASVSPDGRHLYAANYQGGSVAVFPIQEDGSLAAATQVVRHEGVGPDPERQEGPHPHMVLLVPSGRMAYVPDLGIDEVVGYAVDARSGELAQSYSLRIAPGSGPRHLALHPRGGLAFVVNELNSTISCVRLEDDSPSVAQTLSTVPDDCDVPNAPAAIRTDDTGRRVYVTNRGHDSVAVFAVDPAGPRLSLVRHVPAGGAHPVDLALAGDTMLVANQESDSVVVLQDRSGQDQWEPVATLTVPTPACVLPATD